MLKLRLQLRWLHFNFLQKSCLMMFTWNRLLLVSWIDKFIEDPHRDTWKACRCFINISVKFGRYPFVHTLWNKQSTVVKVFIILSTRQGKTKSSWGEIELLYFIFYRLLHMLYLRGVICAYKSWRLNAVSIIIVLSAHLLWALSCLN